MLFSPILLCHNVMELIKGKVIDPLEDLGAVEKIAGVLDYFATLRHTTPGSLWRALSWAPLPRHRRSGIRESRRDGEVV